MDHSFEEHRYSLDSYFTTDAGLSFIESQFIMYTTHAFEQHPSSYNSVIKPIELCM